MGVNRRRLAVIIVLLAVCAALLGAGVALLITGESGTLAIIMVLLGGWGAAGAALGVDVG
jgi:hypothetical protein